MRIVKRVLLILAILPAFVLTYLAIAVVGSLIPVNKGFIQAENGIEIYVRSNGVHTDIVVPVHSIVFDWTNKLKSSDFKGQESELNYLGFGWGDKGFYLSTPTWADLKISTAFNAMFWLSTSAVHVTGYRTAPKEGPLAKKIKITAEQYLKIIGHIDRAFQKDKDQQYRLIQNAHYIGMNDNFYEGVGTYSLFNTCNCWTNEGLKNSGINTALFAPSSWSVMRYRN
jgi:uncharacterized protein (TIGR02117 family)